MDSDIITTSNGEHGRGFASQRVTELTAALVLSASALLSSYCAFEGDLWRSRQAHNYSKSGVVRAQAGRAVTVTRQSNIIDAMLLTQWLNAELNDKPQLAQMYRERFRPDFRPLFERWLAADPLHNPAAPSTPFALAGSARDPSAQAKSLDEEADRLFQAADEANANSDGYSHASAILSVALFMGGIVQVFKRPKLRILLLAVGSLFCLLGVVKILTLPMLRML